jgi:cell division protein FtsL
MSVKRIVVKDGVCMLRDVRVPRPQPSDPFAARTLMRRIVALVALFGAFSVVTVWVSEKHARCGYAVYSALQEQRALRQRNDYYKVEILALGSPGRIEALAKNELKMVDPRLDRIRH